MATTSTTTTTTTILRKSGKKDLKAFIRFDGRGMVVPSSVILARKMPKVGKWMEINAYECCAPTIPAYPSTICIAGLGEKDGEFNGTYIAIELSLGKPHYQKEGDYDIYWDGSKWKIGDSIYSNDDVFDPTLVTTWVGTGGSMTIIEGTCPTTTTTTTVVPTTTTTTTTETPATTTTTTETPATTTTTTETPATTTTTTGEGG